VRDVPGSVDGLQAGAGQPPCQDLHYLAEAWTRDAAIGQLQRRAGSREFGKLEADQSGSACSSRNTGALNMKVSRTGSGS
jgi:hypothetical protein